MARAARSRRLTSLVIVLSLFPSHVGIPSNIANAAGGAAASVRLTLEGRPDTAAGSVTNPDTFASSLVTTGTKAVGVIFPVSVIVDTDGAAVNAFVLQASYNPVDFHIVSPIDGSDITSFPDTTQTSGSVNVLLQNAINFPSAGASNVINNTTGSGILAFGSDPSDTDAQIYSQSDTAAPTGYDNGSDRLFTMYFKAMRLVTNGAIGFAADAGTTQQLIRYGDWMNVGTGTEEDLYIDANASGTVNAGDTRLTAVSTLPGYAAGTIVAALDTDAGTALAGGRVAGAMYRDTASNSTFDLAADPVYLNLDYPNTTVSTGDLRVLPTGLAYVAGTVVAATDTDAAGVLLPLANVRQTGAGAALTDLVGTVGVNLNGVIVTGTPPTSAITTASSTCAQTNTAFTVTVTTTPVMQGVPVTLTSSNMTGLTITPVAPIQNATTAQTNASGVATFTVTSTTTGARTFTGTAGGVAATASAAVNFQATACTFTIAGTITGTIGIVAMGVTPSGSTSSVGGATNTYVTAALAPATYVVTPTLAGCTFAPVSRNVTITNANVTGQDFVATCSGIPSASLSTISASAPCVVSGGVATGTVTVTVRNTSNAVISGASAALLQGSGTSTIVLPNPATTNGSGVATFTVSSASAQSVTYTALVNGSVTLTQTTTISYAASCTGSISGTITGTTGAVTMTITPSGSTTSAGGATNTYISTGLTVGTYTVTPSLSNCTFTPASRSVPVTTTAVTGQNFVATCSTATPQSLTISPSCIVASSSSNTSSTVTLQFSGTNTANALASSISISPTTSVSLSPSSLTTSGTGSGSVTVTANSSALGMHMVAATIASTTVSAQLNIVSSSASCGATVSSSNSSISAGQACVVSGGVATGTVTVTVRNTSGAVMSGQSVSLIQASGTSTITPATATSNASGVATFTVSSATAQSVTYSALVNGSVTLTQQASVNFATFCTGSISGAITGTTGAITMTIAPSGSTTSTGGATNTYSSSGLTAGTYTVTPSLTNCTFTPFSRSVTLSSSNAAGQSFVATCVTPVTRTVSLPRDVSVEAGEQFILPLRVSNGLGIGSFALSVFYDPNLVDYVGTFGSIDTASFSFVDGLIDADGGMKELLVGGTSSTPIAMSSEATLAYLMFSANAATSGAASFQLMYGTDDIAGASFIDGLVAITPVTPSAANSAVAFVDGCDTDGSTVLATVQAVVRDAAGDPIPGARVTIVQSVSSAEAIFSPVGASFGYADADENGVATIYALWEQPYDALGSATFIHAAANDTIIAEGIPSPLPSSCRFVPPTCSTFTYSDWGTCSNGLKTRNVASALPAYCTGGSPDVIRSCTPTFLSGTADVAITITSPKNKDDEDLTTDSSSIDLRGTSGVDVAIVEVNGTAATLDSVSHEWRYRASLDDGDNSFTIRGYSSDRSTSSVASITITRDVEAPGAVKNLRIEATGNGAKLTWKSPSDDDVEKYHVYRMSGKTGVELTTTRTLSATVTGIGTFAVTAEDAVGNESDLDDAPRVTLARDSGFSDVLSSSNASAAIALLRERSIVQGRGNGTFDPNGLVTRGEFAKMLAGVRGVSPEAGAAPFSDVSPRSSLAGYIAAIAKRGWASGQGGFFGPDRYVTRIEAARMIVQAAGLPSGGNIDFSDVTDPTERQLVAAIVKAGVASGNNGRFEPYRSLTRSEAAIMLAAIVNEA
ncbi:MAG: S-layer homology domain-containing protein [Thermoanaerobaculia bacterium]|jgi:hypothetical protein